MGGHQRGVSILCGRYKADKRAWVVCVLLLVFVWGVCGCWGGGQGEMTPLVAALKDRDVSVREAAAKALGWRGAKEKGALRALIEALKDKYNNKFNVVRHEAMIALGRIKTQDPAAIRAIIETLRGEDKSLHKRAVETLQEIGVAALPFLNEAYKDKDQTFRQHILLVLGLWGSRWEVDIPLLREALKEKAPEIRKYAAMSLGVIKMPSPSIPALREALKDADGAVRFEAARVLAVLGVHAAALPVLKKVAQKDWNYRVRFDAAKVLWKVGEKARALAVLEREWDMRPKQLLDVPMVREEAVRALVKMKGDLAAVLPLLDKALQDKSEGVRYEALKTGITLKVESKRLQPIFLQALKAKSHLERGRAVQLLGEMGAKEGFVVPYLLLALGDKKRNVRVEALRAFEKLGVGAKAAIPVLLKFMEEQDHEIFALVAKVLGQLAAEPDRVLPRLLQVFSQSEGRFAADGMRGGLEGYGARALPTLLSALRSSNRTFQGVALVLLGELRGKAKSAIPQIMAFLKDTSEYHRFYAARALARIGAVDLAIPALIKLFETQIWSIQEGAVKELKEVGKVAILGLKQALRSKSKCVRLEAARVLVFLGEDRVSALSVLLRMIEEKEASLRTRAAYGLGRLGEKAQEGILVLEKALGDRDVEVRRTVSRALYRIARAMTKEGRFGRVAEPAFHPASRPTTSLK